MSVSAELRQLAAGVARRCLGVRQFNHLARFEPVLALLIELNPERRAMTVLDVGSGSSGVTSLLPGEWATTALDANFDDYAPPRRRRALAPNQVVGDVRSLPFADSSFDVVVALDLLEHVPPEDRVRAASEICRVSRRRAVIAGPAGSNALAADRELAGELVSKGRTVPGWLVEHLDYEFPDAREIEASCAPYGTVRTYQSDNIVARTRVVAAEQRIVSAAVLRLACIPTERLLRSRHESARRIASALLEKARGGDLPPTYRAVVVVDRNRSTSSAMRHSTE